MKSHRLRRPITGLLAVGALLLGTLPATAAAATPTPVKAAAAAAVADGIPTSKTLWSGDSLRSKNGAYRMNLQADGNLVVYSGSKAVWNTKTFGQGRVKLSLQTDGNLVLRTATTNKVLWHSNSAGRGVTKLVLANTGSVILYNDRGQAIWTSASGLTGHGAPQAVKSTTDFYLPFPKGTSYRISQSPGGKTSHSSGNSRYAIDFSMPTGSKVVASRGGTVKEARFISGGGGYSVLLDHGSNQCTLYAHLSTFKVSVGQKVKTGELLALSGASGNASGPHLHFSLVTCSYGAASVVKTVEMGTNYPTGTVAVSKNG